MHTERERERKKEKYIYIYDNHIYIATVRLLEIIIILFILSSKIMLENFQKFLCTYTS